MISFLIFYLNEICKADVYTRLGDILEGTLLVLVLSHADTDFITAIMDDGLYKSDSMVTTTFRTGQDELPPDDSTDFGVSTGSTHSGSTTVGTAVGTTNTGTVSGDSKSETSLAYENSTTKSTLRTGSTSHLTSMGLSTYSSTKADMLDSVYVGTEDVDQNIWTFIPRNWTLYADTGASSATTGSVIMWIVAIALFYI